MVLRDPVDFAHSLYMQRLRDGYSGTMSDYLELLGPHLDWRKLIGRWSAVFGDNCVIPLVYDDHTRRNLLAYFMASLFPRMIAPAALSPTRIDTSSIPASLGARVRELNLLDRPDREEVLKALIDSAGGHDQPADPDSILNEDTARQLRENCRWPSQIAP